MTDCTRCRAKSENFGCQRCANQLRTMLATLPDWLAELETTATGQAKLGGPVRRSPRYRRPLDGDAHPIAPFPKDGEESLAKAIRDRYDSVRRDALARGRVNARASELAEKVHGVLLMWVRDLCETRGIEFPRFDEVRVGSWVVVAGRNLENIGHEPSTTTLLTRWLHANVSAIAASEDFDLIYTEIAEVIRDIERAVDVPRPPHMFGPCPEMVDEGHDEDCDQKHPHQCDTELRGHRRATEVKCDSCGTVQPIEGLFERQAEFAGGNSYTLVELSETILPALREYVPLRTMQHWAATGRLNPTGYSEKGDPRFLLNDVRALWTAAMDEQKVAKVKGRQS